jgi:hypothetical protein
MYVSVINDFIFVCLFFLLHQKMSGRKKEMMLKVKMALSTTGEAALPATICVGAAFQLLFIQWYVSYGYQFPFQPTMVLLPGWALFAFAATFFLGTDKRSLVETSNIIKNKSSQNQLPVDKDIIELEGKINRIFASKVLCFAPVWLLANIVLEFRKEHIPFYSVTFLAVFILLAMALDSYKQGVICWTDSRSITRKFMDDEEDEDDEDDDIVEIGPKKKSTENTSNV